MNPLIKKTVHLLISALLLGWALAAHSAQAQTNQGSFHLSGASQISFQNTFADGESQSVFTLQPSFGFFVVDNLSLGLTGLVTYQSGLESTTYAAMPTLTYYINMGRGFIPYVGLGLGYVGMATKDINVGGLGIGVEAGGVLMLNDHVGIDLGLQYLRQQYPVDEIKSSANTLGATLGVTAFF